MGGRRIRLDPLDVEVEGSKERRRQPERMNRRADVVDEAGQRQLGRPEAAAELLLGLVNLHLQPRARQCDRRRETVRAGADDDGAFHLGRGSNTDTRWSSTRPNGARTRTRYGSG